MMTRLPLKKLVLILGKIYNEVNVNTFWTAIFGGKHGIVNMQHFTYSLHWAAGNFFLFPKQKIYIGGL